VPRRPEARSCELAQPGSCGAGSECVELESGSFCAQVVTRPNLLDTVPHDAGLVVLEAMRPEVGFGTRPSHCKCTKPENFLSVTLNKEQVLPLTQAEGNSLRSLSCSGPTCGELTCELPTKKRQRLIGYYHRFPTGWGGTFEVVRSIPVD